MKLTRLLCFLYGLDDHRAVFEPISLGSVSLCQSGCQDTYAPSGGWHVTCLCDDYHGKVHDVTCATQLKIPKGSFVVIDRSYHDFELYNSYNGNGIRFVSRARSNAKFDVVQSLPVDATTHVLSDEIIQFTGCYTRKKYLKKLRCIRYFDEKSNNEYVFLINDFELDAKVIADIYKARWEIEIFFKTIKQNLKIKRFMGTIANAVMTQVWIAQIAYLLVSFQKFMHKSKQSIQTIFRLIQINLMERKPIEIRVKEKQHKPTDSTEPAQMALFKA